MGNSKIIYGNETLIDLTADTVVAGKLLSGYTAHGADGELVTGTCDYDMKTSTFTATASEILATKTAGVNGQTVTGSMTNNGGVTLTIDDKNDEIAIAVGYHDGSGKAVIDATEKAKIIAENIKRGVTLLGVTGTCDPASGITVQSKTVTPYTTEQTVLPDSGYDYLSQVTVSAIAYTSVLNAAGGYTVTIGTVAPA